MDSKLKNKKGKAASHAVSDIQLRDLAERIGKEWEKLAINLKFRVDEIERLKNDHDYLEDRIFQLLIEWRQRQPPGAKDNISTLRKALQKSGRNDLASDLGEPTFDVEACRDELITFYKTHMGFIQLIPWDDETEAMDAMFVDLELTHERTRRRNNQSGKLLNSNEELFTLETWEGKKVNRVLISGGPGSGKSTLLDKLAYDWAQQKENSPLSRFALVFLINFRQMTESTSTLTGAIFDQLLPIHSNVSQPKLEQYIRNNQGSCLILADGFDERSSGVIDTKSANEVESILTYKDYRDCFLVVSTRPHKIYNLGSASKMYTQVGLSGFFEENIGTYIHRFFGDDRKSAHSLIAEISKSKNLEKLSKIPYMLLLLCLIWSEDEDLPETHTKLYQQAVFYMWKRYCFKQDLSHEPDPDDTLQQQLDEFLVKLGKSVFNSLPEGKEDQDEEQILFPQHCFGRETCERACEVGILTKGKVRSKIPGSSNISFVHKSFQEFCTACHLADLARKYPGAFTQFLETLHGRDEVSRFFEVLAFACGLDVSVAKSVLQYLTEVFYYLSPQVTYVTHGKYGIWPLFVFALESGISYEVLHEMFQSLFTSKILISPESLSDVEWVAFETFLHSASKSGRKSILNNIVSLDCGDFLESNCIGLLAMILDKMVPKLESLALRSAFEISPSVSDQTKLAKAITKLPHLFDLTIINLAYNVLQSKGIDAFDLTIFLSSISCKQFVHLDIRDSKNQKRMFEIDRFTEYLSTQSLMSSFVISNLCLDSQKARALLQVLKNVLNLKHLHISCTRIEEAGEEIDHFVSRLEHLKLSECELNDDHINHFGVNAIKLQSLNLFHNNFGHCQRLGVQMQYCHALEDLYLSFAHITSDGIESVSRSLPNMPQLKTLDVRYNEFGLKGLQALFMGLHSSEKLKSFYCGPCQVPSSDPCSLVMSECLAVAGVDCPVKRRVHKVILIEIEDAEKINRMFVNRSWQNRAIPDVVDEPQEKKQQEDLGKVYSAAHGGHTSTVESANVGSATDTTDAKDDDEIPPDVGNDDAGKDRRPDRAGFEMEDKPRQRDRKSSTSDCVGCRCILA